MGTSPSDPRTEAGGADPSPDLPLIAAAIAAHEAHRPPPAPVPDSRWRSAGRREALRG